MYGPHVHKAPDSRCLIQAQCLAPFYNRVQCLSRSSGQSEGRLGASGAASGWQAPPARAAWALHGCWALTTVSSAFFSDPHLPPSHRSPSANAHLASILCPPPLRNQRQTPTSPRCLHSQGSSQSPTLPPTKCARAPLKWLLSTQHTTNPWQDLALDLMVCI